MAEFDLNIVITIIIASSSKVRTESLILLLDMIMSSEDPKFVIARVETQQEFILNSIFNKEENTENGLHLAASDSCTGSHFTKYKSMYAI